MEKNKLYLYNRDGASLWIELEIEEPKIWKGQLKIDSKHEYCLEYMRIIRNCSNEIEAVDPSGGPMISLEDEIENFKIIEILNPTTFLLSERNNN